MALLLTIKIVLLTFITSTAATRDNRPCSEMIQGPLYHDSNFAQVFHSRMVDENNTLTLRCRVICQEHGAYYTPHIRIITTKDGVVHDRRNESLFSTDKSPSDNTCDQANPTRDYEFRITARSDILNESIATCALFYQSLAESDFTDTCSTSSLVWIILPNRPTIPPPTTTVPPTTPTESITQETTSPAMPSADSRRYIPEGVSIVFIIAVFIIVVAVPVIVVVWFMYKRFGKHRKKKTSVKPTQLVIKQQGHGGYYVTEDLESVNNAQTGQHVASRVKQRTMTPTQ